ncbi:transporter substrate-binding domain-containing protein [uncultured Pseudodesulfovibrio sp.]|uniref:substrate-binding periplasmic protein n=1 Tax=uncultured Pseudodesulfovibrio sp. TaxID=2035858 RepID=UPI0029C7303A|nr:transporter substrate-binding domain-containing protein [uncultured Pseudodesulfovibrio sp.]
MGKNHDHICALLSAFLFLLFCSPSASNAVEIKEVISTSPSWETFTNEDGSGLYHEVLQKVFALYGLPVRHIYANSGRSEELVARNEADMMVCDDVAAPPLELAQYPMYENDFYVFFNKDRIGPWRGIESLRDKEILSQPTYYSQNNFSVPVSVKDVSTGQQALAIIVLNRSDFYVDDLALINESIAKNTIPFDRNDFDIQKVGKRSYHPLFNTTERGQATREMFDKGIIQLHRSGALKAIYDKWGHQYPNFESYSTKSITLVADEWCPYNCAPGSRLPGFLVEIAQRIFSQHGYKVVYMTMPWSRAVHDVKAGKFDAAVGALRNDAQSFIFPEMELGFSQHGFFTTQSDWKYSDTESLLDKTFGTVRSYSYGKAIDDLIANKIINVEEVGSSTPFRMNIEKLTQGRIDFMIAERSVFSRYLKEHKLSKRIFYAGTPDLGEPVFIAFSPKKKTSKEYAKLLSTGIVKLRESGELARILEKYGLEDWQSRSM